MSVQIKTRGVTVGHYTDTDYQTGCTVILCLEGAVAGISIRGPALGTHETDLVRSGQVVNRVNAVVLAGGGPFGLEAVQGVMQFLEENGAGFRRGHIVVPIVTAATLFDIGLATKHYPDKKAGYQACTVASNLSPEGRIGAGTGALVGKGFGLDYVSKGGIGLASTEIGSSTVTSIVVVNCFGCVVDPTTQEVIAGPHDPITKQMLCNWDEASEGSSSQPFAHNLLAAIITDLPLTKEEANDLADEAYEGFTRVVRPTGSIFDSSVIYTLSTMSNSQEPIPNNLLRRLKSVSRDLIAQAVLRAVVVD